MNVTNYAELKYIDITTCKDKMLKYIYLLCSK